MFGRLPSILTRLHRFAGEHLVTRPVGGSYALTRCSGGPVGNRNPASLRAREDSVTYAQAQILTPPIYAERCHGNLFVPLVHELYGSR